MGIGGRVVGRWGRWGKLEEEGVVVEGVLYICMMNWSVGNKVIRLVVVVNE